MLWIVIKIRKVCFLIKELNGVGHPLVLLNVNISALPESQDTQSTDCWFMCVFSICVSCWGCEASHLSMESSGQNTVVGSYSSQSLLTRGLIPVFCIAGECYHLAPGSPTVYISKTFKRTQRRDKTTSLFSEISGSGRRIGKDLKTKTQEIVRP